MRHKLVVLFLISFIVPLLISGIIDVQFLAFVWGVFLVPGIISLILLYVAGLGIDAYIQKRGTPENNLKHILSSRIFTGGYIGLGIGILPLILLLLCFLKNCEGGVSFMFIPFIPAILYVLGILLGFLWNFRWGKPLAYSLIFITLIPVIVLVIEMLG